VSARPALPWIAGAAFVAVVFWSLKPVFVTLVGDRASFSEIFVVAGSISVATSLLVSLALWKDVAALVSSRKTLRGVAYAGASGFFLALWYYGFYRALYNSQKVDATIIAFTWPLIAILAVRLFAPEHARPLKLTELSLILIAFLGAIAIGVGRSVAFGFTDDGEIGYAFLAAFGSGLYLPFALRSISTLDEVLGSKLRATFFSISLSNLFSLTGVAAVFWATGTGLYFYALDTYSVMICAMIGIGTYLLAEMIWTWAFSEYKSLTLSSLVYFSPALSVVYLYVFFDVPVSSLSAFGLLIILFTNMTLHGMYHVNNAVISALIGTLFVALLSFFVRPGGNPDLVDILYFVSGLFAILAGFILSRVSSRRAEELDQRAALVRSLVLMRRPGDVEQEDLIDAALRRIVDIEFEDSLSHKEALALRAKAEFGRFGPSERGKADRALEQFDRWFTVHRDRLSFGEKAALWLTGATSILLLLVVRSDHFLSNLGLFAFSAGCLLVIFTIFDYERNNVHGFRRQFARIQEGFQEIGRSVYVPASIYLTKEFSTIPGITRIRFLSEEGEIEEHEVRPGRSVFGALYWICALFLVGSLLLLPLSSTSFRAQEIERIVRPSLSARSVGTLFNDGADPVRIGSFDWDASQVIANILRVVVEENTDERVAIEQSGLDTIFKEMADPQGHFDVHPDLWVQNQPANVAEFVDRLGAVELNDRPYSGEQGVYLPRELAARMEIERFSDLASQEVARRFDQDGDGLGEIWIGARGWKSTEVMRAKLHSLDMDRFWEAEVFSDTIFKAKLERFVETGKPIVFYAYEPDWIHAEFDLVRLSEPSAEENAEEGADHCVNALRVLAAEGGTAARGVPCAFPTVDVHIAFASRLRETKPEVADILSRVSFSGKNISDFLFKTAREGLSPREVAVAWVEEHPERVAEWLPPSKAAETPQP